MATADDKITCIHRFSTLTKDGNHGCVWSVHAIAAKKRFGPYAGEVVMEEDVDDKVDFRFAWEVINKETGKLMHVVNATKPEVGNWMRYVNCARFFEEQNIVSVQDGAEVFYEALKDKPAVHTNLFQEDQSSQSSIQSSKNDLDSRNPDYSDSDSELLDLMIELELRKHRERDAIDQDAEQACEDCLRRHKHSILLEAPAKWSAEDFEKIRFGKHGKNGLVYSVCSMCHRYYGGVDFLIRHQWKKHPSIQCSHMDVELGHNLETLFYLQPSTHGILAQSVLLPPEHLNLDTYTCTRCKTSFKQYNRLRAHILNCDPNAPTPPHVRRKKLKQRNRHRFMEKMFSGPSTASSELKYQGKEASLPRKDHTSSSGGKQLGQTAVSKMHSQGSSGKYQLTGSSSKNSVRTPSTNSSRSSTPTKMKSGHNREMMSPSRMSNYSPSSQGSLSPTTGRGRKRRNYELLYNPAAHVRRRETAECLEVHQCRGCGLRCKTLSLLERHARKCSGKEKLQSQRPVMNRFLEAAGSKKHPCHYCPKRFTYLKGVANHYRNNFCRMRLERIARGGLSAEDLKHEADLAESILRQAWNKTENRDHTDVIQLGISPEHRKP
nr:hypothetical protein BaRGS_021685 [Batillaria attramentaria]